MDKFAEISSASLNAATGTYGTREPTVAELRAGNYKKGRVCIYDLKIAIETPAGQRRFGKTDGTPWSVICMASYGEIERTKGADGDPLDVFIGPWPESETAYVVNQNTKDGRFDEVKILLCFPSEESAVSAYTNSYERNEARIGSLIKCSVTQLKWWIKYGDTTKPLTRQALPYDGRTDMNDITWDQDANPVERDLPAILYGLRRSEDADLLLDAVTVADILEDADSEMALDALIIPLNKLERKMTQLNRIMGSVSGKVQPVAMQITPPFKQRGTTNVAVIFEMSDGQSVSIFFHNPDTTPNRLTPDDEMVSWKWLLNKKDVTILVAPERGRDLNPREVGRRIMRVADKNSARFATANAKKAERMESIAVMKTTVQEKEALLASLNTEIEVLTVKVEAKRRTKAPDPGSQTGKAVNAGHAEFIAAGFTLVGGYEYVKSVEGVGKKFTFNIRSVSSGFPVRLTIRFTGGFTGGAIEVGTASTPAQAIGLVNSEMARRLADSGDEDGKTIDWSKATNVDDYAKLAAMGMVRINDAGAENLYFEKDGAAYYTKLLETDDYRARIGQEVDFSGIVDPIAADLDPTTPEGYAKVMADEALQLEHQDQLDSFFQGRIVDVRNALRQLEWFGTEQMFTKANGKHRMTHDVATVGAGSNVVGVKYQLLDQKGIEVFGRQDDLTKTPKEIASEIDAAFPEQKDATVIPVEGDNAAITEILSRHVPALIKHAQKMHGYLKAEKIDKLTYETMSHSEFSVSYHEGGTSGSVVFAKDGDYSKVAEAIGQPDADKIKAIVGAEKAAIAEKEASGYFKANPFNKPTSITLAWSEGSNDSNVKFSTMDELDAWFKRTYSNQEKSGGYSKNSVQITLENSQGETLNIEPRLDVSSSGGDFNPSIESVASYLRGIGYDGNTPRKMSNGTTVYAEIPAGGASPAVAEDPDAEIVAIAVAAARSGAGGITRIVTAKRFTFDVEGEDLILTDDLRAKVEAALGEKLVEKVFPEFSLETALVPASSVEAESADKAFRHAGFNIYPVTVAGKSKWAVQSIDNLAKESAGERQIGGDTIVTSKELAIVEAERQVARRAQDEDLAKRLDDEHMARADAEAKRVAMFADFVAYMGYTPANAEKARQKLLQQVMADGKAITLKDLVERDVTEGRAVTNDDGERGLEHADGRIRLQKKIGKIAIDYAEFLISQKKPASEDGDSATSEATAFLQTVISGSADMMSDDMAERLTKIAEENEGNSEVMALFEKAAEAYSSYMIAEAQKALGN